MKMKDEFETMVWWENHDCSNTEEMKVPTTPGSFDTRFVTIKVCPECKDLYHGISVNRNGQF